MTKTLRHGVVAAGVAATLLTGTPPAAAVTSATFDGSATIGCFGCGVYGPAGISVSFTVNGIYDNVVMVGNKGTAAVTVFEGTGVSCLVSGAGTGAVTITGDPAGTRSVSWTRVGNIASLTISKPGTTPINGTAFLTFTNISVPPCGSSASMTFVGNLA